MIVLQARPSPGFRDAVDAIFGPGVIVHVDEAEPLDAVAGEITALLHVLTPVTGEFIASAPKRSEEHTSELQSLMRISYAVFCLKKKKQNRQICRDSNQTTHMQHHN